MLTRNLNIIGAILPSAVLLAISGGCSSSSKSSAPVTDSRHSTTSIAATDEARDREDADTGYQYRTDETSEGNSPMYSDDFMADGRTRVRLASSVTETGIASAADQQDRVVLVTSEPPPPLRIEFPPREPRDGEFWVSGHWRGESGQYVWQPGRIERNRPGQLYVGAYWVPTPRGWEYTPESWR